MIDPYNIHPNAEKNTEKNSTREVLDNISHFMESLNTEMRLNDHLHRADERSGAEWRAVKDSLEKIHRKWSTQKSLTEARLSTEYHQ